jgi:surfactin synthase thioesterase subunit
MCLSWFVFWVYLAIPSTDGFGQVGRYELGNRLRRFERAWETADLTIRPLSTPRMEKAVGAFFALRLSEAARQLDQAWLVTQAEHAQDATTGWLISHRIACDTRLFDATTTAIGVKRQPLYSVELEDPPIVKIRLRLQKDSDRGFQEKVVAWDDMTKGYRWNHGAIGAGDYRLSILATTNDRPGLEIGEIMLSYCDRLEDRLQSCRAGAEKYRKTGTSTGIATVRDTCNQLESILKGNVSEADVPADRRLRFCEELIEANCQSPNRLNASQPGDYWVTLGNGGRSLPVRLNMPADVDRPLPVLIAFHGAGGSENMFFETYGAGRLVSLAEERGWLVVSPRQGLFGLRMDVSQILQVLSDHFEIDRERVFLVGHSMGAGQVVSQCERHGELVAKAVAIGGGRTPRNRESLKHPQWLVSAGERDFGRRGAASLARGLRELGVTVDYVEVPDVEHMVIVQASLDAVFRFLEGD